MLGATVGRAHSQLEGAERGDGRGGTGSERSCDGRSQAGRGSRARGAALLCSYRQWKERRVQVASRDRGAAAEPEPRTRRQKGEERQRASRQNKTKVAAAVVLVLAIAGVAFRNQRRAQWKSEQLQLAPFLCVTFFFLKWNSSA